MSTSQLLSRPARKNSLTREEREFFGARKTGSQGLPDPEALVRNLAMSAVEIIAGTRPLDQISCWITTPVAAELSLRRTLQSQRNAVAKDRRHVPHVFGSSLVTSPSDGVIEAVVTIHSRIKSKAVAVRLESIDHRWRATALSVL
jgi:hypothetical protein